MRPARMVATHVRQAGRRSTHLDLLVLPLAPQRVRVVLSGRRGRPCCLLPHPLLQQSTGSWPPGPLSRLQQAAGSRRSRKSPM